MNEADQQSLLTLANASIDHGIQTGHPLQVELSDLSAPLREHGASFVTLLIKKELRGCVGTLEAHQPLALDIAGHAFSAAFRDPRFPPVTARERKKLDLHLSILSPPSPVVFEDEADLLRQMRPDIDGLILSEGGRRGTFLPSVWEQCPTPAEFLNHLKIKAGLPMDYWSNTLTVERYEVFAIPSQ